MYQRIRYLPVILGEKIKREIVCLQARIFYNLLEIDFVDSVLQVTDSVV
jgi:hypothetical protein